MSARVPSIFGPKKAHDWVVEQLADFFRTTHKGKTHEVTEPGSTVWSLETLIMSPTLETLSFVSYLTDVSGPVPLALDL